MKLAVLTLLVGLVLVCSSEALPVGDNVEVEASEGNWWTRLKAKFANMNVQDAQEKIQQAKERITTFISEHNLGESANNIFQASKQMTKQLIAAANNALNPEDQQP